jgi:hypothetical protein
MGEVDGNESRVDIRSVEKKQIGTNTFNRQMWSNYAIIRVLVVQVGPSELFELQIRINVFVFGQGRA